jgi:hypothetical protein
MAAAMIPSCAAFLLALTLLVDPMVAPQEPGSALGEPTGTVDGLTVVSESLRLDLRPLGAGREHVLVESEYRIVNGGARRSVTLTWPTGGARLLDEIQGGVWLDNTPVALGAAPLTPVPQDWIVPATSPGLGAAEPRPLALSAWGKDLMTFTLDLPTGEHALRLRHGARPAPDHSRTPALWQLAYVLAPARRWSSFRLLEVEVLLPPGWNVATDPALARTSAGLRGTFAVIPADALTLTAQGPITRSLASPLPREGRPDPRRRALKIAITVLVLPGAFILVAFFALRWLVSRRNH